MAAEELQPQERERARNRRLGGAHLQAFDAVRLHDWLQLIDDATSEVRTQLFWKSGVIGLRKLKIVALSIHAGGRVDAQDQCGTGDIGTVWSAAMNGQGGARRDIAHLRHLLLRTTFIAR